MTKQKKKWKLIFKGQLDEFDSNISLQFWKDKSAEEKFNETTLLIKQAHAIKGNSLQDASRLLRTTAVLKRQ